MPFNVLLQFLQYDYITTLKLYVKKIEKISEIILKKAII